ncbi:hypothetical protein TNCV_4683381 [Trichonephila clavipes]|nr:hypothetical protein TNCV_4683381 [Trichonephila clavipes]
MISSIIAVCDIPKGVCSLPGVGDIDIRRLLENSTTKTYFHIGKTANGASHCSATRGLLVTDLVILNHGQVTRRTHEEAPPLLTPTPTGGRLSSRQIESASLPFTMGLLWFWARTHDKASHDPTPIPLGYRGRLVLS